MDIRVIQVLLGHQKLENTALYSQVATRTLREVTGPLEHLHWGRTRPPDPGRPCPGRGWRSRTSSATTGRLGARRRPGT